MHELASWRPRWTRMMAPLLAFGLATTMQMATVSPAGATTITSAGPLTNIETTPDLNCAVNHEGDVDGEFYDDWACATLVTDGTSLYGPAHIPAGSGATGVGGYIPWTPVSQTGVTGSGTVADPYKMVTIASGGPFTVTQTDTYILGRESVQTDVMVQSSAAVNATIYRAGDCYLQGDDYGLGAVVAGVAPTCRAVPGSAQPDRILQWYPLTAGSRYMVDGYDVVWGAVGSMQPFPNTALSGEPDGYDNGGGLSWTMAIAGGAAVTVSHRTIFSPTGNLPLTVTKSVTPDTVDPGGQVTYTITVSNPHDGDEPLSSIVDTLPAGFSYVVGTTSGASTTDPTVSGATLTWSGSFSVPGGTSEAPGTLSLTFSATASTVPGTYTNSANVVASEGVPVVGAVDAAPVVVREPITTTTTTARFSPVSVVPTFTG